MVSELHKKHGGKRKGAGRPSKFGEPTVRKHVPVSLVPELDEMIKGKVRDGVRRVCKATGTDSKVAGKAFEAPGKTGKRGSE